MSEEINRINIGKEISKSIKLANWVELKYLNKKGEDTTFWFFVDDINPDKKILVGKMCNYQKSTTIFNDISLIFDNILSAKNIEGTIGDFNEKLIMKIKKIFINFHF